MKYSLRFKFLFSLGVVSAYVVLLLLFVSVNYQPIIAKDGDLKNWASLVIGSGVAIYIAISLFLYSEDSKKKIGEIIIEQKKTNELRKSFAIGRLQRELVRMENWVSVTNRYIDEYTKERNKPKPDPEELDDLIGWMKHMDGVRNESIRILENTVELFNDAFDNEYEYVFAIEDLIEWGKSFYIPHQRFELAMPMDFRDELTPQIMEKIQWLQEKIGKPDYSGFFNKS